MNLKKYNVLNSRKAIRTSTFLLMILTFQIGCSPKQSSEDLSVEKKPMVVFLVRHAEKVDQSEDPELSLSGKERSLELAKFLSSANIEYIHSSDYIRTRETAAPIAKELGLTAEIYNPGVLEELLQKIKEKGGNHLVVGHSNTTPQMVDLLGGEPGSAIQEASEYDRLYIVTISGDGQVSTVLMRYGQPYLESSKN